MERSLSGFASGDAHDLTRVRLGHVGYHQTVVAGLIDQYLVRRVVLDLTAVYVPRDFGVRFAGDTHFETRHFTLGHVAVVANAHKIRRQRLTFDHFDRLEFVVRFR